jgi:hypothetical protein
MTPLNGDARPELGGAGTGITAGRDSNGCPNRGGPSQSRPQDTPARPGCQEARSPDSAAADLEARWWVWDAAAAAWKPAAKPAAPVRCAVCCAAFCLARRRLLLAQAAWWEAARREAR